MISEIKARYMYILVNIIISSQHFTSCYTFVVLSMADVEDVFHKKGAELSDVVKPIREVNRKHQQVCMHWKLINYSCPDVFCLTPS